MEIIRKTTPKESVEEAGGGRRKWETDLLNMQQVYSSTYSL